MFLSRQSLSRKLEVYFDEREKRRQREKERERERGVDTAANSFMRCNNRSQRMARRETTASRNDGKGRRVN